MIFRFDGMEVICLEEVAFYTLIEKVVDRLKDKFDVQNDKWVSDEEAMHLLNIKSKTTLQKLRDEGKIRFSHPQKKIILYDRESIDGYLENNAQETF
jgi:helix-turn-helix protein